MTAFLSRIAPYKGIQTSESGKFLLVESGIRKTSRFVGSETRNTAQEIWNPVPGICILDSTDKEYGIQCLESRDTAWNPESKYVLDSLTRGDQ